MNKRVGWLLLIVGAALIVGFLVLNRRHTEPAAPPVVTTKPAVTPAPTPAPVSTELLTPRIVPLQPPPIPTVRPVTRPPVRQRVVAAPPPEVPIQDGATIDFSVGAPIVRSGGSDTEALNRALKDIDDAAKDAVFQPRPTQTAAPKK